MSKIVSIGTAVPAYRHRQEDITAFMRRVYAMDEAGGRKLRFLYRQSGIETRYSVIPDYTLPVEQWEFYPPTENLAPFPNLEKRMTWYRRHAADLSMQAIERCLVRKDGITHIVTVSCTGMSAPGLDLELIERMNLPATTIHTSVNFMGCYAAVHALKLADAFCKGDANAKVLIVCTELCTLHFQKEYSPDSITSSMLFSDGAAAVLVSGDNPDGLTIGQFHSTVVSKGRDDMAWELSSKGFLMTLSGYIPELIEQDFDLLVSEALQKAGLSKEHITDWCIHPGGKKILEAVYRSLRFKNAELEPCYQVLREYGNMSSPTILFVLENILKTGIKPSRKIFGAAFGPGICMETFILSA